MRVAIVQPRVSYHVAGSEKVSLKHAEHLARIGHTVDLYTSINKRADESFLFKDFRMKDFENVNILSFDITESTPNLYDKKPDIEHVRWVTESIAFDERIFESLKDRVPDIILSYYLPDSLFKPTNIPNVVYLSGYPRNPIPWYKSFIKFCDASISISSIVSEKWSEELEGVNLKYSLGTGVDFPLITQQQINPRAKYNLVFAGRLIERKGVLTLIEAFRRIVKLNPEVHLWILGEGELRSDIEKRMAALKIEPYVSVMGLVENPYDYFVMADICILPSHHGDGLMGTVLESMAAGKPVVTTTGNGNEDVIANGVNGVLVEPEDPEALARAVLDLIQTDEIRVVMGEKAKEFIMSNVAWEKNVKFLANILQDVVVSSHASGKGAGSRII